MVDIMKFVTVKMNESEAIDMIVTTMKTSHVPMLSGGIFLSLLRADQTPALYAT